MPRASNPSSPTAKPFTYLIKWSLLCVIAWCIPATAFTQLRISEAVIEMGADEHYRFIRFHNDSDSSINITLDLQRVLSPASATLHAERTAPANTENVTITPQTMEIPANQSAQVKIRNAAKPLELTADQVYRLKVRPVLTANSSSIVLNYDLLLLIRPEQAAPSISLQRTQAGVVLVNTGNTNALMSSMRLCDLSIDDCTQLSPQRLYATQRWSVPVPTHFNDNHLVLHAEQAHRNVRETREYRAISLGAL